MRQNFLCSAASLLYPDSGGSRQPLDRQVRYYSEAPRLASELWGNPAYRALGPRPAFPPNAQKRRSERSGVLLSCAGHWPPKQLVGGGFFHRTYYRLPRPVHPFFEGRFVGGGSCRGSAVLWAGRTFLQQPVHHWHLTISNSHAVSNISCFQRLDKLIERELSAFWKASWRDYSKNHRCLPYCWQCGQ